MFQSGQWRGYWEQAGWGRQPMAALNLSFAGGKVRGGGTDCIGPFTVAGQYDSAGAIRLVKKYVGRHTVLYEGVHDGEGTIFGRWSIGDTGKGSFALSPDRLALTADEPIIDIQPPR